MRLKKVVKRAVGGVNKDWSLPFGADAFGSLGPGRESKWRLNKLCQMGMDEGQRGRRWFGWDVSGLVYLSNISWSVRPRCRLIVLTGDDEPGRGAGTGQKNSAGYLSRVVVDRWDPARVDPRQ